MGCGAVVVSGVECVGKTTRRQAGQGSGVDGAMNVRPVRWQQGDGGRQGRPGQVRAGNDRERRKGRAAHPVCAARPAVETGRAGGSCLWCGFACLLARV
jgi:hypothetical protein